MMVVRSISFRPVRGSSSSGNSVKISTTSLALSPQAAMTTISASACLEMACCRTVLPLPKGPGMKPVPPSTIGLSVSMTRTPVSKSLKGRGFSRYVFTASFTGHFWIMLTFTSCFFSFSRTAMVSDALYSPSGTTDFTVYFPVNLNGTMIRCGISFSEVSPSQSPARTLSPAFAMGLKCHF